MPFTSVFGAQPIYSAQPSLLTLALTANTELDWPLETVDGAAVLATIIDATPDAGGRVITMPDARNGTPGYAVTFANNGAFTYTVNDNTGAGLISVGSGERWTVYLRTNSAQAGTWGSFQQGAGTSSANAGALAGAGLKAVGSTLNAKFQPSAKGVNYVITTADRALIVAWTGGVGQFTLPDPAVAGSDWYCGIKNAGTGSLTVVPAAGLIDSAGSLVLSTGESAFLYTDGANFFTVGLGQEINSVFDFISINVAGTGTYTLAGVELNRVSYKLTGVLTGNRDIVVPATTQQYWVDNETTGAFTVTLKCTGGVDPGKTITQNNRNIFYCNGANVLDAVSSAFTPPLAVGSGGTGATNAANARSNLGSTAVGDAVFIAVSAAAARLTLGASATGDALFTAASAAAARATLGITAVNITTVVKAVTTSRNTTTVLADDPELVITGLTANKSYAVEAFLAWDQSGATTNGFKMAPNGNGTGTITSWMADGTTNTSAANAPPTANAAGFAGQFAETIGTAGLTEYTRLTGVLNTGGGVGGLAIQWAQAASLGTATRLLSGSWLKVTQLN